MYSWLIYRTIEPDADAVTVIVVGIPTVTVEGTEIVRVGSERFCREISIYPSLQSITVPVIIIELIIVLFKSFIFI